MIVTKVSISNEILWKNIKILQLRAEIDPYTLMCYFEIYECCWEMFEMAS
jgi:hypothetical protein